MSTTSNVRFLYDVGVIFALGFVYVLALSVGTLGSAARKTVTSARSAGTAVGKRLRRSARQGQ